MSVTIQNMTGGDRRTVRTIAALARIAATHMRLGGWEIVEFTGLVSLNEDEVRSILRWASSELRQTPRVPKVAADWEDIAHRAIAFERATGGPR